MAGQPVVAPLVPRCSGAVNASQRRATELRESAAVRKVELGCYVSTLQLDHQLLLKE